MTICIGALFSVPGGGQGVILCSDTRGTVPGFASSDRTWKFETLGYRIEGMISGQLSCGRELASIYRGYMGTGDTRIELTRTNILDHLKAPPRLLKRKLIDDYFGLRWGISYQQFLDGALNNLQPSELFRIDTEINAITFPDGTSMLISSLALGNPDLFVVDTNGQVYIEDDFAVVGSGYAVARASLSQRRYHGFFPLAYALYSVYEAKKLSEVDPNVGPDTVTRVTYIRDGESKQHLITTEDERKLDIYFSTLGPQRLAGLEVPPDLAEKFIRIEPG
jgi:20S proteasome alpha/beta subunit